MRAVSAMARSQTRDSAVTGREMGNATARVEDPAERERRRRRQRQRQRQRSNSKQQNTEAECNGAGTESSDGCRQQDRMPDESDVLGKSAFAGC
jgi:hypothetical protein